MNQLNISPEEVESRRLSDEHLHSAVAAIRRDGFVVLNDMWHAGMPNRTPQPRPMIAMIHTASWFDVGAPLRFPKSSEAFFADSPLKTCARFVEGDIDYLRAPQAYEYQAKA